MPRPAADVTNHASPADARRQVEQPRTVERLVRELMTQALGIVGGDRVIASAHGVARNHLGHGGRQLAARLTRQAARRWHAAPHGGKVCEGDMASAKTTARGKS